MNPCPPEEPASKAYLCPKTVAGPPGPPGPPGGDIPVVSVEEAPIDGVTSGVFGEIHILPTGDSDVPYQGWQQVAESGPTVWAEVVYKDYLDGYLSSELGPIDEELEDHEDRISGTENKLAVLGNFGLPQDGIYPPEFSKTGLIIPNDTGTIPGIIPTSCVEVQKYDGNFPYKFAMVCSVDHGAGNYTGLRLYFSDQLGSGWIKWNSPEAIAALTLAGYNVPSAINNGAVPISSFPIAASGQGEYFFPVWYKGEWYVYGHEFQLPTSSQSQCTFLAKGPDLLNLVYQCALNIPSADPAPPTIAAPGLPLHNGYLIPRTEGGSIAFYGGVIFPVGPIAGSRYISHDGYNLSQDTSDIHYGVWGRIYGNTTHEAQHNCPPFFVNGGWWVIGVWRLIATSGLSNNQAQIMMYRVASPDSYRPIGMPIYIGKLGGSADFDRDQVKFFGAIAYDFDNGEIWCYYSGWRTDTNTNNVGAIKLNVSRSNINYDPVINIPASHYESAANTETFTTRAWPPFGRQWFERKIDFLDGTISPELNVTSPGGGSVIASGLGAGGRGNLDIYSPSLANWSGFLWDGIDIDLNEFDQVWFDVNGLRFSPVDFSSTLRDFQFGFVNAADTRYSIWHMILYIGAPGNRGIRYTDSAGSAVTVPSLWDDMWMNPYNCRERMPHDFSFGLTRYKNTQNESYKWYAQVWRRNECFHCVPMNSIDASTTYRPRLRCRGMTLSIASIGARLAARQNT